MATQRRELDRQLEQLATGPGERITRVNRELEETRRKLTALRAPDGSNQGDIDTAIRAGGDHRPPPDRRDRAAGA